MAKKLTDAELHSAGAIVRHKSPFSALPTYTNTQKITHGFYMKWAWPYQFRRYTQPDEWLDQIIQLKPKITEEIILKNLGDFNWRTRSAGSFFAAIKQSYSLEDIIGTHLLKSEVCYAGHQYAHTLASFNTKKSPEYLSKYLSYYLKRPDLYYDQEIVITALKYLDEINGTSHLNGLLKGWNSYLKWRDKDAVEKLERLKKMVPDKADELEEEIKEYEPLAGLITTEYFRERMVFYNQIING